MRNRKNDEVMTAEDYKKLAQKYRDEMATQWKTFLLTGLILLAILIFGLILSMAWFASNTKVKANPTVITVKDDSFQLRTKGNKQGFFDKELIAEFFKNVFLEDDPISSVLTTSSEKWNISWLVSAESNLGNYFADEDFYDYSDPDKMRSDYAISPGAEGNLTFYIVPNASGTQQFELNLEIIPYSVTVDKESGRITEVNEVGISSDTEKRKFARQYINGHIILFLRNPEEPDKYSRLDENTFTVTIENAVADEEYPFTIYWKWPQTFSEMLLRTGDPYLNGREPIFTADNRAEIVANMAAKPELYFHNSLVSHPLENTDVLIPSLEDIYEKSPLIDGEGTEGYNAQDFIDLSSYYNQADQIIGETISFLKLELSAAQGGNGN